MSFDEYTVDSPNARYSESCTLAVQFKLMHIRVRGWMERWLRAALLKLQAQCHVMVRGKLGSVDEGSRGVVCRALIYGMTFVATEYASAVNPRSMAHRVMRR